MKRIRFDKSKMQWCGIVGLLCFFFGSIPALAQEKQLVQVKTFDQQLKPMPGIEISLNGKPYVDMGSKGVAFVELSEDELQLKSVSVKDDQMEAASWNYSKGIIEITIRKKSYKVISVYVRDANNKAMSGLEVVFNGKKSLKATTDPGGKIELILAADEKIRAADQFRVSNYRVLRLVLSDKENVLTIQAPEPVAMLTPGNKQEPEANYFKGFDLSKIDSIQSLTAFYAIFKNYSVSDMSPEIKQKLDEKLNQLVRHLKDSIGNRETTFVGKISDSSFVIDDIRTLIREATVESQILEGQRQDFDEKIRIINEKVAAAGDDLDEATRTVLLSDLRRLEELLERNESRFYKNQNDYRSVLNAMKEKFFHMNVLENKLSISEAKRLEEQRIFRKRLFTILSVALVFALLVILLIYFSNKLRKQKKALVIANDQVKKINENLEGLVDERTKLLKETNRELDLFLYRASHDLRSPVTSIIGLCNIAMHISQAESKDLFERTEQTAMAMDRLLKKLRIISEINAPGDFSFIELLPMVNEIKHQFDTDIQQHRIKFDMDCPEDLVFYSNQKLLDAILYNLVENALFYCSLKNSATPEVQFRAGMENGCLEFSIYDNGVGIDTAIREKLFDMFFKGHEASKGNGLGLYIVRKSVQAIKGYVTIESEPNAYTRITVSIPVSESQPVKKQVIKTNGNPLTLHEGV